MDDAALVGGVFSRGDRIDGDPTRGSDDSHSGTDASSLGVFDPSLIHAPH
jgi:hypothetical protein